VIPFFIGKRVKFVTASRSMSIAITEENEIFRWGFIGDEFSQFSLLEEFKEEIIDVKLGTTFLLVLTSNGKVYFKGAIS